MEKEIKLTPTIGERVWIKVFSNWSLGTYVGYDVTINKHYVREDADGGGHLLSSSQVLPESANPNGIENKIQTPVEWLVECIMSRGLYTKEMLEEFEQAKQMEYDNTRRIAYNAYNYGQLDDPTEGKFNKFFSESFKSE